MFREVSAFVGISAIFELTALTRTMSGQKSPVEEAG